MHRARVASSQLEDLLPAGPSGGIPSISTARAQAWWRFAQVIHMLMHTAGQQSCCRAGSPQQISVPGLRDMPAMPGARTRRGWDRARRHRCSPPPYRTGGPCIHWLPAGHAHPASRSAQAPRPVTVGLRYPSHELERDAATPSNARFRSRSRTPPVPGHDCGPSRWRISGGCGVPWRCQPGHSGRAESRQGPSMYEMEGPCPASPHRLASCLALLAQRAARRGRVPVRGTDLPAPPTFPGSPPGGARFRTVRTFLLPSREPRKSPRPAISGLSAIHK
jgi:hypothetical protein